MPRDEDLWAAWDAGRRSGRLPTEMARDLDEGEIGRLLADAGEGRDDERKLLAAEMLRRLTDQEQALNRETLPESTGAEAHRGVVNAAAETIHAVERKLERLDASQRVQPDLRAAHKASLLAEEHRAQVETAIERRAERTEALDALQRRLDRGDHEP